jgi:hypothetical protein
VSVYLRNAHPKQIVHLPIAPGWSRVLRPAVTTRVPERVLHTPAVRQLVLRKLVDVVDGAAWDADARQRRASRTDMARAIAAAEQREFDQLLQGVRIRQTRWGAHKNTTAPYGVLVAATTAAGLDTGALKALLNGEIALPATLKGLGVKRLVTERRPSKHQSFVHWRQRNQSARTLLTAAQKTLETTDPQAAATWLVSQCAGARWYRRTGRSGLDARAGSAARVPLAGERPGAGHCRRTRCVGWRGAAQGTRSGVARTACRARCSPADRSNRNVLVRQHRLGRRSWWRPAMAKAQDDLLVLCARAGLRLFDDYLICDGDITVVTEEGQRKLEAAAARDPILARHLYDASGVEVDKLLDHGSLSPRMRHRLTQLWWRARNAAI